MNASRAAAVLALLAVSSPAAAQRAPAAAPARRLQAQSSYEPLRTRDCTGGYRTTGVRYLVVGSSQFSEGRPPHLVLEERITLEQCENLEGPTRAEVSVVARPAARPDARPAWLIRRRGEAGGLADEFPGEQMYRVTEYGCCGSENLDSYYSLATGRLLFTADHPLLFVDAAPFGTGLVAVHDAQAAGAPAGRADDRTLVAAVSFGATRGTAQRVLLRGPSPNFHVYRLELVARGPGGREKHAQSLGANDELGPGWTVWVAMEIEAMTVADATARVEIPIENGRMEIAKARVPAPFRLSAAPAR